MGAGGGEGEVRGGSIAKSRRREGIFDRDCNTNETETRANSCGCIVSGEIKPDFTGD